MGASTLLTRQTQAAFRRRDGGSAAKEEPEERTISRSSARRFRRGSLVPKAIGCKSAAAFRFRPCSSAGNFQRRSGLVYPGRSLSEAVRLLLSAGADVNARNIVGETPLHDAAANGQSEVAALLIAGGADPVASDDDGWSPLMVAEYFDQPAVIEVLTGRGPD
jgi:hypothetical protein